MEEEEREARRVVTADSEMVEEEVTLGVKAPDTEARGVRVEELKGVTVRVDDTVIQLAVIEEDRVGVTEAVVVGVVVCESTGLTVGALEVDTDTQKDWVGVKVLLTLQDSDPEVVKDPMEE